MNHNRTTLPEPNYLITLQHKSGVCKTYSVLATSYGDAERFGLRFIQTQERDNVNWCIRSIMWLDKTG